MAPIYVGMLEGDIYLYSNLEKENMKGRNRTQTFGRGKSKENFTKKLREANHIHQDFYEAIFTCIHPLPQWIIFVKNIIKVNILVQHMNSTCLMF